MDFNNDGHLDLLIGERNGMSFLYEGVSSGLLAAVNLKASGKVIDVGYNSSPRLVDWNEDGYLDLVLGGYNGGSNSGFLRLYLNTGSNPNELNFTTYTNLQFWNKYRTTHEFYDMDNDGDKDMILGLENGQAHFAENTGTNSAPVFSSTSKIYANGNLIDIGSRARESICDWNEDGVPDLVLGNTTDDKIRVYIGAFASTSVEENEVDPVKYGFDITESPSTGLLAINMNAHKACGVSVSVYNCAGRVVAGYDWSLPEGNSTVTCNINANPPGLYTLTADFGDRVLTDRVMLVR